MLARCLVVLLALSLTACSGGDAERQLAETTTITRTETVGGGADDGADDVFGRIPELVEALEPSIVTVTTERAKAAVSSTTAPARSSRTTT